MFGAARFTDGGGAGCPGAGETGTEPTRAGSLPESCIGRSTCCTHCWVSSFCCHIAPSSIEPGMATITNPIATITSPRSRSRLRKSQLRLLDTKFRDTSLGLGLLLPAPPAESEQDQPGQDERDSEDH